MITNSARVKRQGYDVPSEQPAYGQQPSNGYETPKAPANNNGYETPREPISNNGYESPTANGPVPAGQRQGAFRPAANPPSALYCQCDSIICPPGPPGVCF